MPLELTKKNKLLLLLGGFFLTNALLAEMIGPKIFSLEKLLNLSPAHISFFGLYTLDFNLTAGVIIWPIVFIVSDVINEYFGKKGVQLVSFATAGFILFSFGVIYIAAHLPPADFWLTVNNTDNQGRYFDIDYAFSTLFRQGLGIIVGSLTAFLIGQLIDATVFQWIKKATGHRMVWLRATGSTVVSQLIDSFVVLFIAFYAFGNWKFELVMAVAIMNFMYKIFVAILLIPLLYIGHYFIDKYLQE